MAEKVSKADKAPRNPDGTYVWTKERELLRLAERTFIQSAEANKVDKMKEILEEYGDEMDQYCKDRALYSAAWLGSLDAVKFLIDGDIADVDELSNSGDGPLHKACWGGHAEVVKYILEKTKLGIDYKDGKGRTPLYSAIASKNLELAELLIGMGADAGLITKDRDFSVLLIAVMSQSARIVKLVLDSKDDVDVNHQNDSGNTALHFAVNHSPKTNGTTILEMLLKRKPKLELKNHEGKTALFYAAQYGLLAHCELLLSAGADPNTEDQRGCSVIRYAVASKKSVKAAEVLLRHGALLHTVKDATIQKMLPLCKPNLELKDNEGKTALFRAAQEGLIARCEILLEAGADPHTTDSYGRSILRHAVHFGMVGLTKILLKCGADPNSKDRFGLSMLRHAVCSGRHAVIEHLLHYGADPNEKVEDYSLLHIVCAATDDETVDSETVRMLLRHGADPNASMVTGETPLHFAAYKGSAEAAWQLLVSGADRDKLVRGEFTPLHFASVYHGQESDIVSALRTPMFG